MWLLHFRTFSGAAFSNGDYSALECGLKALIVRLSVGTRGAQFKIMGVAARSEQGGSGGTDGRVFGCFFFSVSCFSLGLPVFWLACF